jgi:peptidoglycan/LPS O-acetylase OafA/YrhL
MPNVAKAQAPWPSRYELLDGLRGLAALAVLLHHLQIVSIGHFAVMVFFIISGYCITASADSHLVAGTGFQAFMVRRVRRIYPPYLLALTYYSITRVIKAALFGQNELNRPALDWLQNLTLTQWVSNVFHPVQWPGENPTLFVAAFWSLNYEEQFYLIMGIGLFAALRLGIPLMWTVLAIGIAGLAWNWLIPGNWIYGFFVEYWVHFALGSCLYFALCRYTGTRSRWTFVSLTALLGSMCFVRLIPVNADTIYDMRAMVELSLLSVVTLVLFFLRPYSSRVTGYKLWRPIAILGTISYSLYLIHQFNLTLIESIARHALPAKSPGFVTAIVTIVLHLALATMFWYCCERPFLRKNATTKAGPEVAVTAKTHS